MIYSETSIYRSVMYRFPSSSVQFLCSLDKSYLNYRNKTRISRSSFSRIYWSEFLMPKNVNPGLIVFEKGQHHTHKYWYTSVVVTAVDGFGTWCSKLQFWLCTMRPWRVLLTYDELEGRGGWREPDPAGKTFLYVSVNVIDTETMLFSWLITFLKRSIANWTWQWK
jgi:hypothetical protein